MTTPSTGVELIDPAVAPYDDLLACARATCAIWPKPDVTPESMAQDNLKRQAAGEFAPDQHHWYVIRATQSHRVIAHANCFPRKVTLAGKTATILALGGVCTLPEFRKQGLGSAVIRACFARVDRGEFPYSLFQTSNKNRPLYGQLGCALITNRIVNSLAEKPDAYPFWDEIAMFYPATRPLPAGTIDLLGPGY